MLISVLLWCIAGIRFYNKTASVKPEGMAATVSEQLQKSQKDFNTILADQQLINRIFAEQLTLGDVDRLTRLPYYVYAYDNSLRFWNSNDMLTGCTSTRPEETTILTTEKGTYLKQCYSPYADKQKKLVVVYPIVTRYPFENSYLKSHFEAAEYIPLNTEIQTKKSSINYPVVDIDDNIVFYLDFSKAFLSEWSPGKPFIWIIMAALISSIVWLQLITIYYTRKRSYWVGLLITIGAVFGARALTYVFGLPFNLDSLPIFSPRLYASSSFLPSLGDLMLNALCILWLVVFMVRHTPRLFATIKLNILFRMLIGVICALVIVWYSFDFVTVIRSLIIDSSISFDVSHFYSISFYTLVGLSAIAVITGSSCLAIYFINLQLSDVITNRWLKYLLVAITGWVLILLYEGGLSHKFLYSLLLWLMVFLAFLDIKKLTNITDLLAPPVIFWALFVCVFCTGAIQYFSRIKERETRKTFAEQVAQQRDYVTEYTFKNISQSIQGDPSLKNFFQYPSAERRRIINERFDALYLGGQLNNYDARLLLYSAKGEPLFNNDTTALATLRDEKAQAEPAMDVATLYYKPYAEDGRYYVADIPVVDTIKLDTFGYAIIDLAVKESSSETVYPELLQPSSLKPIQEDAGYSYGVYVKNKLITQTADYSLPVSVLSNSDEQHIFYNWENSSELWHKVDKDRTVLVIRYDKPWFESITLFSYLFGIQMLVVGFIIAYRLMLAYLLMPKSSQRFLNLTLKKRIHFAMLAVVLFSFLFIGAVTIVYFNMQYKQSSKKNLQSTMHFIEQGMIQYLKEAGGLANEQAFNDQVNKQQFRYLIKTIADVQKVDINIYKTSGLLSVTSQENIYDKFLLARVIRPDAYYQLRKLNQPLVIQNERIGLLSYLSCYVPLRDDHSNVIAYINIPFFSSQKELNFQISNIVVALINLSAFIFLVSSLLSAFITTWLTRKLSVLMNRFETFSLSKNELIEWSEDDEIGTLVGEYNKMVKKVEENAMLLAQSERESAWREMAQQVAHEIKNPLTPMKLNIQYLQQAIRSGYPNVTQLAEKVSQSLIEQIDNLSYIATEFSNFAKIPEAKPEEIVINELLQKGVELYLNEPNVEVKMIDHTSPLIIYADKSQLIRVLTNLLENAVQSIPEERPGHVLVILKEEDGYALITIHDDGEGIPDDIVDRIFQPYFTTKTSGTGLGLAMTKKIIEFWQGRIWFDTVPEKGTTFFIKLPLLGTNTDTATEA
jgi:Signal transduction histidine kinase involved in nitrogen fixation and metabolism regulation